MTSSTPEIGVVRGDLGSGLDHHVVTLGLVLDLVGETALAPEVDMAALGALRLDELEPPFNGSPDRLLIQVRVDNDHHFVRTRRARLRQGRRYLLRTAAQLRAPRSIRWTASGQDRSVVNR